MVVGAQQSAASQPVNQVAKNGKGYCMPVKGGGAASQLVDDDQRMRGCLAEHYLNVLHFDQEGAGRHRARQFVYRHVVGKARARVHVQSDWLRRSSTLALTQRGILQNVETLANTIIRFTIIS
jgi:hypothetical protein